MLQSIVSGHLLVNHSSNRPVSASRSINRSVLYRSLNCRSLDQSMNYSTTVSAILWARTLSVRPPWSAPTASPDHLAEVWSVGGRKVAAKRAIHGENAAASQQAAASQWRNNETALFFFFILAATFNCRLLQLYTVFTMILYLKNIDTM